MTERQALFRWRRPAHRLQYGRATVLWGAKKTMNRMKAAMIVVLGAALGACQQTTRLGAPVAVMVGKCAPHAHVDPGLRECGEELPRGADSGEGQHRLRPQHGKRLRVRLEMRVEHRQARRCFERSMHLAEGMGDRALAARGLRQLGLLDQVEGRLGAALACFEKALEWVDAMGDKAEAMAIRAQAEALRQNPNLIELRKVERWDGSVPQWNGTGPLPLLNLSGGPIAQPQN